MKPADFHLALLARHQDRVRALVQALLSDEHAAEDVVQDAWVRALERGPRDPEASGAWFARVAERLALNRLRSRRNRDARERLVARDEAVPSSAEIAARVELERRVLDAIDALPELHRAVLRDRYLGELAPTALARRDGLSLETVKSRLARARAALRKELDREPFDDGAPWSLALLPLVETVWRTAPAAAAAPLLPAGLGALAVKKIALVTVVATVALVGVWQFPTEGDPGDPRERVVGSNPVNDLARPEPERVAASHANGTTATSEPLDETRARVPASASPDSAHPSVAGTVQLARVGGPPAIALKVELTACAGFEADGEVLHRAKLRTDADGSFRFELTDLPGVSTLTARVAHPDYLAFEHPPQTWVAGEAAPTFALYVTPLDATLAGVVRTPAGAPVPGARVHWGDYVAECDGSGAYALRVAAASLYTVNAVAEGYGRVQASVKGVEPGTVAKLDFTLDSELRVAGVVRDESGAPLEGATVRANHPAPEVVTDAAGHFELPNLPRSARDTIFVYTHKAGYCLDSAQLDVPEVEHLTLDPVLKRGAEVAGRVVDAGGRPLAGAELWIGHQHGYDRLDARAGVDGRFVFDGVPEGPQRITAEHEGHAPATLTFRVPEGARNVPDLIVELGAGRSVRGVVRDAQGVPLEGIGLSAQRGRDYVNSHGRTDADGRFELRNLPPGDLRISAYALGWVRFEELFDADADDLMIELQPAGRIAGRVVDAATGAPLTSFTIRIVDPILAAGDRTLGSYSSVWADRGKTFSDAEGRWDLGDEELEPGRVTGIEATAPGYAAAVLTRVVVAAPGDETEWVLALGQPLEVAVELLTEPGGLPVADARVVASQEELPQDFDRRWTGTTDSAGACVLEDVAPGPLWVAIERPDVPTVHLGPFDIAPSPSRQRLELRVPAGASLQGVTRDDATRAPRGGVELVLSALEVEGVPSLSLERTSAADGTFRFDELPPGLYQLSRVARLGEHTTHALSLKLRIEPGVAALEQDLVGPVGTGVVTGALEAEFELPEGTVVSLLQRDGELPPVRSAFVVDGRFEFTGIPAGTYLVTAMQVAPNTGQMFYAGCDAEVQEGGRAEVALQYQEL